MAVLGVGYVMVNAAVVVMLGYFLSLFRISSVEVVIEMCGIILFLLASISMMIVGAAIIIGGLKYHRGDSVRGVMFLGTLFASLYLLCLGMGSVLLLPEISLHAMLIVGSILVMAGTALYVLRPFPSKVIGSTLGILGAVLLAFVIFRVQVFSLVFVEWNVPFPGPFMSMTIVEAIALILGSAALVVYSVLEEYRGGSMKYVFLPIATLVFGIGLFIGPLILAFSLWDLVWKAPWLPPLHGVPRWVMNATIFWSAGLFVLSAGGVLLIMSSYLGFHFAVSTEGK